MITRTKKVCELCRKNPATVPDRNRPGRPIARICSSCHGARLAGDLRRVLAVASEPPEVRS